eukprot:CAMPEP_0181174334 /NCGR_PEP_ID=MMETSP1096-20121128/3477_1 /TAXON_ID=156174 ORGANISM="Chrysochromulina ericina, Strain CCMP281" /NCGR_SAMPLE_ID=MMETSP1096 /ASSEMBLY_ACC=CAM_ASM_000453 /LENGTH=30 /DNA_ID= /DNA_START= /DNA_END= /DNA_ORIENTATION=
MSGGRGIVGAAEGTPTIRMEQASTLDLAQP